MKAFEVSLNRRTILTAGLGTDVGVLHAVVEIHGGILNAMVQGSNALTRETLRWAFPDPKVGDEITIKIVETDEISPPLHRWTLDEGWSVKPIS